MPIAPKTKAGVLPALALLSGAWLLHEGLATHAPPQPDRADAFSAASPAPASPAPAAPAPAAPSSPGALPPSVPRRIVIPVLHVSAPLVRLALNRDRTLAAPPVGDRNLAGWYAAGTAPGSVGTAVIAGHVDTERGPAVFYGLGALHKGDHIDVARADGRTAVFTVDAVEVYAKTAFPSAKVYGAATRPELRLITCGGGFSRTSGYLGNVVVYAHLTAARVISRQ